MSKPRTFAKKINVVEALKNLGGLSYPLTRQLINEGYVEAVKDAEAKKPGRGRMPHRYEITRKGQNLVRLSANWAKPKANDASTA